MEAFKTHYRGYQVLTEETAIILDEYMRSDDFFTAFIGQSIYALWDDLEPADNAL